MYESAEPILEKVEQQKKTCFIDGWESGYQAGYKAAMREAIKVMRYKECKAGKLDE